ncbi:ras-GEF domain-containing family member 1B isoform X2 [Drosophila willistoni]|uniref:ras-GEF domain-containing family member 1B isoform X2 n=1 Tax=Drosophila willistoni TaxID=7260 RepID=UPI000C26C65A|nr:ras-GEF domain-containing family member 1B isoform X2 [Drosophila willistoni]
MAMYFYASKISAIACGTRCKQTVLQKSRGQRDRDKCRHRQRHHHRRHRHHHQQCSSSDSESADDGCCLENEPADAGIFSLDASSNLTAETTLGLGIPMGGRDGIEGLVGAGIRFRRRHSAEQLSAYDLEMGFQKIELATLANPLGMANNRDDVVQYDVPKNPHKRSQCDINFESSVLGSGGIMYINGRIVSGPLDSLVEVLIPKNVIDLDKEFIFSFLLSSRLFLRPHELLGKLLDSVPDSECLESLVALLAEWTQKFPYDYRDERMMNHVKHIVARCSQSHLEAVVSQILSALLKRLTDLERHEADLRACQQTNSENNKVATAAAPVTPLNSPTATQYAQIVCRLEKKLAKHIGAEEFLQCSSMILLDKQKWDQPSTSGGPPGAQDPKKTCNLETYLDWSARLRLFVCNEILQCAGIEERSRTVELWSGVAQYCLLVGNYNSATAILESLESPAIARLKITWSKLQVTCQQLDCMQRHAEGHGHLWQKQAIVLNEQLHQQQQQQQEQSQQAEQQQESHKTDKQTKALLSMTEKPSTSSSSLLSSSSSSAAAAGLMALALSTSAPGTAVAAAASGTATATATNMDEKPSTSGITGTSGMNAIPISASLSSSTMESALAPTAAGNINTETLPATTTITTATTSTTISTPTTSSSGKPNDWVVIPVFADIVKLALAERENCLQRLPNGHININAFDRMAAIVGAFTKHMQATKGSQAPTSGEYEQFCWHMQQTTKLAETELMMASFDCEEPNNAEKLMYDLN